MASSPILEPSAKMALPVDFHSIRKIYDMDPDVIVKTRPFVNVIGLVRDYQPPKATGGTGRSSLTANRVDLRLTDT
jgi:hypothetical protein